MLNAGRSRLLVAAVLVVAWVTLFLRHFAGTVVLARVPVWLDAVPLALAVVLAVRGTWTRRERTGVWIAIALIAASLALLSFPPRENESVEQAWRHDASERVAATLAAVGDDVARLEGLSVALGERAAVSLVGRTSLLREDRPGAFALLDSLAASVPGADTRMSGSEIGVHLFDRSGERVAWAGWPQALSRLDTLFVGRNVEIFYTRRVSLYQILSHILPIHAPDGSRMATLMVDMPLEVDYRVNNRFLKSSSLADHIPRDAVGRVSFEYYPPTGNLTERLERLREQARVAREARERMMAAAERDPRDDATAPPDSARVGHRTRADSVLSYYDFPVNVEPVGDIGGTAESGLQGRVLVRSRVGNPLLNVTAVSHPLSHYVGQRATERRAWGRVLALAALIAVFVRVLAWLPASASRRVRLARAAAVAAFVVALRYALLAFGPGTGWARAALFDASVFATPALGGLMRSSFDLALTALALVALVYGLVRVLRGPGGERSVPSRGAVWIPVQALLIAAGFAVACELIRATTETVVVNANPRLLGEGMALTDAGVVVLHIGVFLMSSGILLAAMFTAWGLFRALGETRRRTVCAAALAMVAVWCVGVGRWDPLLISAMMALFVLYAPRVAHREDLVSVGIAAFALVIIAASAAYVHLSRDYDELRKGFVLEKSNEINNPADNWKVVILEDVLGGFTERHEIHQALRSPTSMDVGRLAFDVWADSPLSLLGYSCAIHIVTPGDSVISEFSVDMPYRARIAEGGERTDTPDRNRWAVLDLTRSTPQGVVRFYRGVLNVDESVFYNDEQVPERLLGKVIVDLPFFFESLELAARTGPRTPEVLRNVQEGGVAPRVEEPEALLLARIGAGQRVLESSLDQLAVGTRLPAALVQRAGAGEWPRLRAATRTYRVIALATDNPDEQLLAGFVVPSPARHLLRWSTLLSLYLFYTLVAFAAVVALGAVPRVRNVLPTLTPGRRLGFQQKLLASFLLVSLAPAVLLGVFSVNFIKGRFIEENRDEASYKAFSARKAFVNLVHAELQYFLTRADLSELFAPGSRAVRPVAGHRVVALFDDASAPDDAPMVAVAGSVSDVSTEDIAVMTIDGVSYIGVFSAPLRVTGDGWAGGYYVYYGRAVDSDVLGEIAEQVGSDVNIYLDGELTASSREGLLAGGFISATMNAGAFVEVSLLGSDRSLATERAGSYDFQVAYLPVDRWHEARVDSVTTALTSAPTRAALAVPLLFRPESYSLEVQRATSVVLGVFALLLAATIALGLVVARGVFEPLRELVAGTRRISHGDFNVRLRENRSDEIGIVVTAFNEMTERIAESQRALEERRRYLEAILENIGAGVISTDAANRVRTVNSAAERIAGVRGADIAGRTAGEAAGVGRAREIFALLDGVDARPFEAGEIDIETSGRVATVKFMRTRLEADGVYFGTVLVFEDVTELIQSKKLSAWVEMARQIAHEIKNPLTPIRISTQFMRRAYDQRPAEFERIFKEGTETIIHQVDVLKRIAGEFSSFGRMQRLDVAPHAVEALIRGIVAPYENNGAGVRVVYDDRAPEAAVLADPEAVRKICANLIENALEAMGTNGGELRVTVTEASDAGARVVRVSFRDTGPGLEEGIAQRLFEPYFSTKTTGTGLGLAICRTLSREMGGDVTVRNATGTHGVEATLTLRRAPVE